MGNTGNGVALQSVGMVGKRVASNAVVVSSPMPLAPKPTLDILWPAIRQQLQGTLSPASYQTWVAPLHATGLTQLDGHWVLTLAADSGFKRDWVEKHYRGAIVTALIAALNTDAVRVRLAVDTSVVDFQPSLPQLLEIPEEAPPNKAPFKPPVGLPQYVYHQPQHGAASEAMPQATPWISASQPINPSHTFENWVADVKSPMPTAAAQHVVAHPGQGYNPFVIQGVSGLGKTHLLHAMAAQLSATFNGTQRFACLTAEHYTNQLITAFGKKGWDAFREQFRTLDGLFLDDLSFLVGKERTQQELVHVIDALTAAGKPVVVTTSQPLATLGLGCEALLQRLNMGLTVVLQPPSIEALAAMARQQANQKGFVLSESMALTVANQCVSRADAIRALQGALNQWEAQQRWGNTPQPLEATVEQWLTHNTASPVLNPQTLLAAVAEFFHVSTNALASAQRSQALAHARQVSVYVLRNYAHLSYSAIGAVLGNRTHSTLVHAVNKINTLRLNDPRVAQQLATLVAQLGFASAH